MREPGFARRLRREPVEEGVGQEGRLRLVGGIGRRCVARPLGGSRRRQVHVPEVGGQPVTARLEPGEPRLRILGQAHRHRRSRAGRLHRCAATGCRPAPCAGRPPGRCSRKGSADSRAAAWRGRSCRGGHRAACRSARRDGSSGRARYRGSPATARTARLAQNGGRNRSPAAASRSIFGRPHDGMSGDTERIAPPLVGGHEEDIGAHGRLSSDRSVAARRGCGRNSEPPQAPRGNTRPNTILGGRPSSASISCARQIGVVPRRRRETAALPVASNAFACR